MRRRFPAYITLGLLALCGCGTAEAPANKVAPRPSEEPRHSDHPPARSENQHDHVLILSEERNGETVTVPVGRGFAVRLAENRSTAFRWHILELPATIRESDSDYSLPPSPDGQPRVGEGGTRSLHFMAIGPGRGRLILVNNDEPSAQGTAARTFEVEVVTQ